MPTELFLKPEHPLNGKIKFLYDDTEPPSANAAGNDWALLRTNTERLGRKGRGPTRNFALYGEKGTFDHGQLLSMLTGDTVSAVDSFTTGDGYSDNNRIAAELLNGLKGGELDAPSGGQMTLYSPSPGGLIGKGGSVVRALPSLLQSQEGIRRINVKPTGEWPQEQRILANAIPFKLSQLSLDHSPDLGERIDGKIYYITQNEAEGLKTARQAMFQQLDELAALQHYHDRDGTIYYFNAQNMNLATQTVARYLEQENTVLENAGARIRLQFDEIDDPLLRVLLMSRGYSIRFPLTITDSQGMEHHYPEKDDALIERFEALREEYHTALRELTAIPSRNAFIFEPSTMQEVERINQEYVARFRELPNVLKEREDSIHPLVEALSEKGVDFQEAGEHNMEDIFGNPGTTTALVRALITRAGMDAIGLSREENPVTASSSGMQEIRKTPEGQMVDRVLAPLVSKAQEEGSLPPIQSIADIGAFDAASPVISTMIEEVKKEQALSLQIPGARQDLLTVLQDALHGCGLTTFCSSTYDDGIRRHDGLIKDGDGGYFRPDHAPTGIYRFDTPGHIWSEDKPIDQLPLSHSDACHLPELIRNTRAMEEAIRFCHQEILGQPLPETISVSLGLQSRSGNFSGRSDPLIILTVEGIEDKEMIHIKDMLIKTPIPGFRVTNESSSLRSNPLAIEYNQTEPQSLGRIDRSSIQHTLHDAESPYMKGFSVLRGEEKQAILERMTTAQADVNRAASAGIDELVPELTGWKAQVRSAIDQERRPPEPPSPPAPPSDSAPKDLPREPEASDHSHAHDVSAGSVTSADAPQPANPTGDVTDATDMAARLAALQEKLGGGKGKKTI